MAYNDIDSGKVLNKEGLLALCNQIKTEIANNSGGGGGSGFLPISYTYNWTSVNTKQDFVNGLNNGRMVYTASGFTISITPGDITNGRTKFIVVGNSFSNNKVAVQSNQSSLTLKQNYYYYLAKHENEDTIYVFSSPEIWAKVIPVEWTQSMGTYRNTLQTLFDGKQARLTAGTGITISGTTISADSQLPTVPSTDGTYTLQCVVSSGTPTYSWVAVS